MFLYIITFSSETLKSTTSYLLILISLFVNTYRPGLPLPNPRSPEASDRGTQDGGKRLRGERERARGPAETQPQVHFKMVYITFLYFKLKCKPDNIPIIT